MHKVENYSIKIPVGVKSSNYTIHLRVFMDFLNEIRSVPLAPDMHRDELTRIHGIQSLRAVQGDDSQAIGQHGALHPVLHCACHILPLLKTTPCLIKTTDTENARTVAD
jgi:hypothetical protein